MPAPSSPSSDDDGATPPLRWATAADHATVVRLLGALLDGLDPNRSPEGLTMRAGLDADVGQIWATDRARVLLAEADGSAIAVGRADILAHDPLFRLRQPRWCGYIDQMFVAPSWRRRGLGGRILAALEGWLGEAGCSHVLLHAAAPAVGFYRPLGYALQRQMIKRL